MDTFRRRKYQGLGQFFADIRIVVSKRREMRTLMRGDVIGAAFRERLMLAVTSVNRCRYCSYAHSRAALSKGVPREEIAELGRGMFAGSPPEEVPALLYAQHWAESNARPDAAARERVVSNYGENKVDLMELAMRMIRVGNLLGNSFDYVLYRLSLGRWGV